MVLGFYETQKHWHGDAVPAGKPIHDDEYHITVTPPAPGWVQIKSGSLGEEDTTLEFYGPTTETWAVVRVLKGTKRTIDDVVFDRHNAVMQFDESFKMTEERIMSPGHDVPIAFTRYENMEPTWGLESLWWVATVKTEAFTVEVIAATEKKARAQEIEQFVRSVQLIRTGSRP